MADARGSEDRALTINVVIVRTVVIPAVSMKNFTLGFTVYIIISVFTNLKTRNIFTVEAP